jgi:hypothetical protein
MLNGDSRIKQEELIMARAKQKKPKKTRGATKKRNATAKQRGNKLSRSGTRKVAKKRAPARENEFEQQDNRSEEPSEHNDLAEPPVG